LLSDVTFELGFHFFALVDHESELLGTSPLMRINNYPEAWVNELIDGDLTKHDPVHLACLHANTGFGWSELSSLIRIERTHRRILSKSRRHGLGTGFTIPSNVRGEPSQSCSFVVRVGEKLPIQRLRCAEIVGAHALRAARRIRHAEAPVHRPVLTPREVECLSLIARGKTDWEIAQILIISIETVHQYVKRARTAYRAASRAQLIAHAIRDSWIAF
jgi:LuxR family quorum-sensing system transcriptional regulator CciR